MAWLAPLASSIAVVAFAAAIIAFWQFRLRRNAEAELRSAKTLIHHRERKMKTILANAPIVFTAIDKNGFLQISEGKGLEKLGRKDNQSVGWNIFEMHNRNPIILDAVNKALEGHQVATSFVLNGVSYDLFIGPEKDIDGTVIGASMLSVDVTDKMKSEEERAQLQIREQTAIETSKLKSEFLATMSHEIRTPLNGVIGMTDLLLDTHLDAEQREFAEAIHLSGESLLTIINDILDFSKIEAGKLEFESIDFDLPDVVRHTIKSFGFATDEKGIRLNATVPRDAIWVKGDPGRFRQVLNNLIGNAVKFTAKGQVQVRVLTAVSSDSTRHGVRIEVQDTGIGISKEGLERMFIAFTQAEASMSRRFGGTGLGLSIAKQLVTHMGGKIGVESTEGVGSTFWFTLEFERVESAPMNGAAIRTRNPGFITKDGSAPRILLAEDNHVNQVIAVHMLEKMGCVTDVVVDGADAIAALKATPYSLVLMDCQMPRLDGIEATRRIRFENDPLNRDIPILAMTANAMKGDKGLCLGAGMNDYISKPVSYDELTAIVKRWLEIRRKHVEAESRAS